MKLSLTCIFIVVSILANAQHSCCAADTRLLDGAVLWQCDTMNVRMAILRTQGKLGTLKMLSKAQRVNRKEAYHLMFWVPEPGDPKLVYKKGVIRTASVSGPVILLARNTSGEIFLIYSEHELDDVLTTFSKFNRGLTTIHLLASGASAGFFFRGYGDEDWHERQLTIGNPPATDRGLAFYFTPKQYYKIYKEAKMGW